jgi:hypothetical protein
MKWIGNIVIYFGLFIIYLNSFGNQSSFTLSGFFLSLVIAVPLLLLGAWLIGKHEGEEQIQVDRQAKNILDDKNETGQTFFLYLRPFGSTNAYKITDSHLNLFSWEIWERDGFDDIERLVARALSPTASFVALGKPGEHRGAGRVLTTEKDWKEELAGLARRAKLIVIVPSYHEGTLWELQLLVSEKYLDKTIFMMPSADNVFYSSGSRAVSSAWARTQAACQAIGLAIPDATPGGALFKITPSDGRPAIRPLPVPNPVAWMESIQSLIDA